MLYSIVIKRIHISSNCIHILSFFTGRVMGGVWSMIIMFFIMFYQSDYRANLIVPEYDFEINSDDDIGRFGIERVYVMIPHEFIPLYYKPLNVSNPSLYKKVQTEKIKS